MTIERMDNVLIVVEDFEAAKALFRRAGHGAGSSSSAAVGGLRPYRVHLRTLLVLRDLAQELSTVGPQGDDDVVEVVDGDNGCGRES